jgi:hypothetical protein
MDEYFGNVSLGDPADFIGDNLLISQGRRAYQIVDEFSRRGKKVV